MKLKLALIAILVIGLPVVVSAADKTRKAKPQPQKVEQTVEVDPAVNVSVCILSGTVSVHGWDNNQVLARSADAARIEFQRSEGAAQTGRAKTIQVVVIDGENKSDDCQAFSDIEISVPRSATIHVQTREGDITIADVAEAYAVSQNGDIEIQGASRSAEVCSVGGSVMIKDSVGRLNLNSVGGSVEVANVRPANRGDSLEAVTVSGDIDLERVEHVQLNARTVNGNVSLSGPLSRGGRYEFKTMSGDVTLAMPEDASFQLNAKVSQSGEIITDFPLQLTPEPAPAPKAPSQAPSTEGPRSTAPPQLAQPAQPPASPEVAAPPAPLAPRAKVITIEPTFYKLRKIAASHGSGDAIIYVASFSGTLRLKRSE